MDFFKKANIRCEFKTVHCLVIAGTPFGVIHSATLSNQAKLTAVLDARQKVSLYPARGPILIVVGAVVACANLVRDFLLKIAASDVFD